MAKKTFSDLLNWFGLVGDGLVLCKDQSFLVGWELMGQDHESLSVEEQAVVASRFTQAMRTFSDGDTIWIELARRRQRGYHASPEDYESYPLKLIDMERKLTFADLGGHFGNTITLIAQFSVNGDDVDTRFGQKITDAMIHAAEERANEIESALKLVFATRRLRSIEQEVSDFGERERMDELVGRLASSVRGRFQNVASPKVPVFLDTQLRPDWAHESLRELPRVCDRPTAIIGIDGVKARLHVGVLSELERVPQAFSWTTRFEPMSRETALSKIGGTRDLWNMKVRPMFSQLMSKTGGAINEFAIEMAADANAALAEVDAGDVRFGAFTMTVTLFAQDDESEEDVRRSARRVVERLQEAGFDARIEGMNALEAFIGSLPGHPRANVRRPILHTLNLAHLVPLSSVWSGSPKCPHPRFPPNSPALLRASTATGEPYYFNLHSGDVGHGLIFGPTGAGKSVLLSLIVAGFLRYRNAQVFVFDKGLSMLGFTKIVEGTHMNLGGGDTPLAPLSDLGRLGIEYGVEWLIDFARLHDVPITTELRREIGTALAAHQANNYRSLGEFAELVQSADLRAAIEPYVSGAQTGLFDASSDPFEFSAVNVFETSALGDGDKPSRVLTLDYVFRQIDSRLGGRPSQIIIDEAWSFLKDPIFARKIESWLRELRRRNTGVLMATQNLNDVSASSAFEVLKNNVPTRIFLPNPAAESQELRPSYEAIGLTRRQISIIANMVQKQDYYVVQPEGVRVVNFALGPLALSLLGGTDEKYVRALSEAAEADPKNFWHPFAVAAVPGLELKER